MVITVAACSQGPRQMPGLMLQASRAWGGRRDHVPLTGCFQETLAPMIMLAEYERFRG